MANKSIDSFVGEVRRLWKEHEEKGHPLDLRPPAAESAVAAFERKHRIKLSKEYRQFLLELANGGAWIHSLNDFEHRGTFKGIPGDFRKPFPHRRKWNLTARQFASMPEEGIDDAGYAAFWKDYFRPNLIDGAIPVCEGGCSRWYLLVVTGPGHGNVWIDEPGSEAGIFPATNGRGRRLRFDEWYIAYLNYLLARKSVGWIV